MKNIVILLVFLIAVNGALGKSLYYNLHLNLNRMTLRYIIFKEKKLTKIIKNIINNLQHYHNKSIASVAEGVTSYHELSEDEKTLIETIISLGF